MSAGPFDDARAWLFPSQRLIALEMAAFVFLTRATGARIIARCLHGHLLNESVDADKEPIEKALWTTKPSASPGPKPFELLASR